MNLPSNQQPQTVFCRFLDPAHQTCFFHHASKPAASVPCTCPHVSPTTTQEDMLRQGARCSWTDDPSVTGGFTN